MSSLHQWQPTPQNIAFNAGSAALTDILPTLERIVTAFGTNGAGRVLDVDRAQVTRWMKGAPVSPEMARRIVALNEVITRALRQFAPSVAALWLMGSEPLLDGARPLDVLALQGSAAVIRALEGIEAGAYA